MLFNLDQVLSTEARRFPGLEFALQSVPRTFENFELFINAVEQEGGMRLECQYNSELFDAVSVRWLGALEVLLRAGDRPRRHRGRALEVLARRRARDARGDAAAPERSTRPRACPTTFFEQARAHPSARRW